ncbi:MAG: hypothetical protein HQM10_21905 [Candidatus Riflebacteria bacterium]|nr:hypothetical protein [Candidatus Riflebacteria bacterium]
MQSQISSNLFLNNMLVHTRVFSLEKDFLLKDHVIDGTPFVPFVMMLEELVNVGSSTRLSSSVSVSLNEIVSQENDFCFSEGINSDSNKRATELIDVVLSLPIMLRKGRAREISTVSKADLLMLTDAAGNEIIHGKHENSSLSKMVNCVSNELKKYYSIFNLHNNLNDINGIVDTNSYTIKLSEAKVLLSFNRDALYPNFFFHGPSLQADFSILEYCASGAFIEISGLPSRYKDEPHVVAGDLSLQAAALFAISRRNVNLLPLSCTSYSRIDDFPKEIQKLFVYIFEGSTGYNIICFVRTENITNDLYKPIMFWNGLKFTEMSAQPGDSAKKIISKINGIPLIPH